MMGHFFIRCVYLWIIPVLGLIIMLIMVARKYLHKQIIYRHSMAGVLKNNGASTAHWHKEIFYFLRLLTLILLAIGIAKIQIVDKRSKVPIQGIDIVLVLDVSGSMQFKDYDDDNRSRFDVAKTEAIHFIEKRDHDAIGLVLFGKDAISRCPITDDKHLLKNIVEELKLGVIGSEGTMLVTGIVTAANRLKHSKAKSKVMIVLTDGEPSEGDMDPSIGIEIAQKLGIKIYTIGIGSEEEYVFMHPLYGVVSKPKVNKELLTKIAKETDGSYFIAHNAADMRSIYNTIDALEKTDHEVPVFSLYYDLLVPLIAIIMTIILSELLLSTFVWFSL